MKKKVDKIVKETVDKIGKKFCVGASIQWIFSKQDGTADLSMRQYTITSGGIIPIHEHPWEHIIYILQGPGMVFINFSDYEADVGDAFFIPAKTKHAYANYETQDFVFLCIIPNKGDKRDV